MRTDNGGELCRNEFEEFYKKCGIERKNTTPHTPQHNGFAKRMNRTLMEKERSMLCDTWIGQELCAEAMEKAYYLVNQSPTSSSIEKNPQYVWTSKKPSIKHLKVFGCDAYVNVPKEKKKAVG